MVGLFILSVGVLFKVGGCKNDLMGYIEVNKGELIFCNVVDLYFYLNILVVVKVIGE